MSEKIEKLKNQIWITRVSRTNAEKRLLRNDSFIQGINIYYSIITVIISICLLVWPSKTFNVLSLTMTVALLIVIMFFKSLRYPERANTFKQNYTQMQMLEFDLDHCQEKDIQDIEKRYNQLIAQGENHKSCDYYRTLVESNEEYKKNRTELNWKMINKKYRWNLVCRGAIEIITVIFPFILGCLIWLVNTHGWTGV